MIIMMYVYGSTKKNLMGELTPICIESNLGFALPYWTNRKKTNKKLFWVIK